MKKEENSFSIQKTCWAGTRRMVVGQKYLQAQNAPMMSIESKLGSLQEPT
jgi:hypothetical protein